MTSIRPLHDRVIVRRLEAEEKTRGGIIIADTAKEKPLKGEVLAVGPGARDDSGRIVPMDVRVGDTVLFVEYGAMDIKDQNGDELVALKEMNIIGVLDKKAA